MSLRSPSCTNGKIGFNGGRCTACVTIRSKMKACHFDLCTSTENLH